MSCSKQPGEEDTHLRMVLVGKTGAGKSAAGNTILGGKCFISTSSSSSVTDVCRKKTAEFGAQTLAVVDTPGLFDTEKCQDVVKTEIAKCISFTAPGPHVFLVVIQAGRFTEEEQQTVKLIQELFGEKAAEHTMALFTRGDDLEADGVSVDDMIGKNRALNSFISECGDRYHVFNNRSKDSCQVKELLKKINTLVQRNGGRCYTNAMLEEAEKAIGEKQEEILKQNPHMGYAEARIQAEEDNFFIKDVKIRGLTGLIPGPVGAYIGAGIGAIGETAEKACIIQ